MPDTQSNPTGSIFKDRNYNPFSNRPMKKKVHADGMSLSLLHGAIPTQRSNFQTENFFRNGAFILTMCMAGVGISTLTILALFGQLNHSSNVARINNINSSNNIAMVQSQAKSVDVVIPIESTPTSVLGSETQVSNSFLNDGYAVDGGGEFTGGVSSEILLTRPTNSTQKVVYIRDDIQKYDIDSPTKFYMEGGWIVLPFDANGEAKFNFKPQNSGTILLNLFSSTVKYLDYSSKGDIGYIEIDAK